jgi:hypothetical protein
MVGRRRRAAAAAGEDAGDHDHRPGPKAAPHAGQSFSIRNWPK